VSREPELHLRERAVAEHDAALSEEIEVGIGRVHHVDEEYAALGIENAQPIESRDR